MNVNPKAGQPVDDAMLVNVPRLMTAYFTISPDPSEPLQRVAFGTSGHRGSAFDAGFNEAHILAITQAICDYRRQQGIDGPLFLGIDTHALSEAALVTALEVLTANRVETLIDDRGGYTPTPAISHAILTYNAGRTTGLADGIVVTPSHNPPEDGGFKYNPPSGGPADSRATQWIQEAANKLLAARLEGVARAPFERARGAAAVHEYDYVGSYVGDLPNVVDIDILKGSKLRLGVDPLGGAGVGFWSAIAERLAISLTIVSDVVDPTFRFMTADWDGRIRMDCSSPYAMRRLIDVKDRFDVAWACDPDHDRHGIVTRSGGLIEPNRYLAVAIDYLFTHRPGWKAVAAVGKTAVSSSMIDRVTARLGRRLVEVPVGFKWFVEGLVNGELGFGGEESAGASFLRRNGTVWTSDKDGIVMGLLAAEMTAATGRTPDELYGELARELGEPAYRRMDAPATPAQKAALLRLEPEDVTASKLAGEEITAMLTNAPGNGAPLGGLKVVTENGWFAARPSGTEDIYKIYAESFKGEDHLERILDEARVLVGHVMESVAPQPAP
ncbi:MAG TPA: phosphoglucomutase (alpha-D-glucose-1,6-bisphosphate-dependent) [Vicinamibacterales bacterium]|nr:phosphoglucomutase (alpha-D-glucose-1,6-bisphosphate-dependent) [Vicinamibacterales bacterium]